MIKNYLKVAVRNLSGQKPYAIINILGLALGIACCILIFAYIGYEFSYDGFNKNADNIYRLVNRRTVEGRTQELAAATAPMGPTLVRDFPEVIDAVRISPTVKRSFKYREKRFFQTGVFYVDDSIFNVFSFEMIEGDPKTALQAPFTMVLTEETAKKYFGDKSPIGEKINWDNKFDYSVTGVVKSPPANSHFKFEVLASFATYIRYDERIGSRWTTGGFPTYLLLREDADPGKLEAKLGGFIEKYLGEVIKNSGGTLEMYLQSLKNIHLKSHLDNEFEGGGDIRLVRAFIAIAVIILIIACINFMNLATARSHGRAKEVGIRKVLGAQRMQLVFQFLGESFLNVVSAMFFALLFVQLIHPYFNTLASREIPIDFFVMPWMLICLVAILLFAGLFAGSYPAFFLSAYRPAAALKGNLLRSPRGALFRSILVVFQFAISITLVIVTIIISNQQKYMKNLNPGFKKKDMVVIALQNQAVRAGLEAFKNELLKIEGVTAAGASSMVPGESYLFNSRTFPGGKSEDEVFLMDHFRVDDGYLDALQVEIVKGKGFLKEMVSDQREGVLLNETAARRLGWPDPVGKNINIQTDMLDDVRDTVQKRVIGVFRDFHYRSFYSEIGPLFIEYVSNEGPIENRARRLALRLETGDMPATLAKIEQMWKQFYPDHPYYYFFLEDYYDQKHLAEEKLAGIFQAFALLAVIIACLGLFGLASYTAEKRTKEVGIRKVFGSSTTGVAVLLCKDFLRLAAIANVIAWPVAFLVMGRWLENFPYRAGLGPGPFLFTGFFVLTLALLTVGYQSIKAASANPVESLRYE